MFGISETERINRIIKRDAARGRKEFIINQINEFLGSGVRNNMLTGQRYYEGGHDILKKQRTAIGENGSVTVLDNLPNSRIVDNRYRKLVDQKVNYLLGQPIVVRCDNPKFNKYLKEVFNTDMQRLIKNIGEDCLNCGIGWMYVYYDEKGQLAFKRFKPYEIIPGWADSDHTRLDYVIRIYPVTVVKENGGEEIQHHVEFYDESGVYRYIYDGDLERDRPFHSSYFKLNNKEYNWNKIPIIAFKANSREIPLIKNVKALQDGLNTMLSAFQDCMSEDCRNTILILKNYDGENLGEFRRNLAVYGAVKVKTVDGSQGGVDTLNIEVNAENYKTITDMLKKAIVENGNGFDSRDDRLFSSPNQMNIQSMYSDMDLDANSMEVEFQACIRKIIEFIVYDLFNKGIGNFERENTEIIFNRDILINESDAIDNCIKSKELLSLETVVAQHPWIDDINKEMERIAGDKNADDS